jgi:hypothetical protein
VRKKFAAVLAVGTIGVSGLVLAGPALSAVGATEAAATAAAPVDRIKQALSGLVTDKTLTQAQADKVASTLESAGIGKGGFGRGGHGFGADLSAAATALGLSEADLRTALQSGKTLADVAKDQSVSVDTLVAALVKAKTERIQEDVTAGRLTQAQADEKLADLTERITEAVNSTRPTHLKGHRGFKGGGATPPADPSAPATPSTPATPSATPSTSS